MKEKLLIVGASQILTLKGPGRARRGPEMRRLSVLGPNAAVLIEGGLIAAAGAYRQIRRMARGARVLELEGGVLMPGFVDAHTHPVFAGPRLRDFSLRTSGLGYRAVSRRTGGIWSTVGGVRRAGEGRLAQLLGRRALRFLKAGTTTIEAKSGYGLDLKNEIKILEVIGRVGRRGPLEIIPTFLGAHALPPGGNRREYVRLLIEKMIPAVCGKKLARFIDVFCERGYFSVKESEKILRAGLAAGLAPRLHAEQLSRLGGARLAAKLGAASADHLDHAAPGDMAALSRAGTAAILAPASNYFLGGGKWPPARGLIAAGVPVCLASDFNPGSAPVWNMQFVMSVACTQMRMSPEEAVTAATVNGAYSLGEGRRLGSLEPGKQADLAHMDVDDYREIPYYFGVNHCRMTIKKGKIVYRKK
ncbi:MAG: imidazolonepropionase [Elusimicrobia bacterium]|nr:imidazolonepropionase [Elusimicrobiota bacterium]